MAKLQCPSLVSLSPDVALVKCGEKVESWNECFHSRFDFKEAVPLFPYGTAFSSSTARWKGYLWFALPKDVLKADSVWFVYQRVKQFSE